MRLLRRCAGLTCAFLAVTATALADPLHFNAGCEEGDRILIGAVGEVLFQRPLQQQALAPGQSYRRFWRPVGHVLSGLDVTFASLTGPAAHGVSADGRDIRDPGRTLDGDVYDSRTITFNYHPSVLSDLAAGGIDVISVATSHAMDRGPLGGERTVENLEQTGLPFTGLRKRVDKERPWSVLTQKSGFTVGWLGCNAAGGKPDPRGQVLHCHGNKAELMAEVRRLATDPEVHAVIVAPYWGSSQGAGLSRSDRGLARQLVEAGATAVIGTNPGQIGPWDRHSASGGREGLAITSLGSFLSNEKDVQQRAGIIAVLELVKRPGTGKARLSAAGYLPVYVDIGSRGYTVLEQDGAQPDELEALRSTLTLLPAGNRVASAEFRRLPRLCNGQSVRVSAVTGGRGPKGSVQSGSTLPQDGDSAAAALSRAFRASLKPPPEPKAAEPKAAEPKAAEPNAAGPDRKSLASTSKAAPPEAIEKKTAGEKAEEAPVTGRSPAKAVAPSPAGTSAGPQTIGAVEAAAAVDAMATPMPATSSPAQVEDAATVNATPAARAETGERRVRRRISSSGDSGSSGSGSRRGRMSSEELHRFISRDR